MLSINTPISVGELLDKITILQIKSQKIDNVDKLKNINKELEYLITCCKEHNIDLNINLYQDLKNINEKLWVIEDNIRECERLSKFEDKFIELARAVYFSNDIRAKIKYDINKYFKSELIEEKSYKPY